MISIEKFRALNGNAPGVRVRFAWIEPTHEVVELLQKHGLTEGFHSVSGTYTVPDDVLAVSSEEQMDDLCDLHSRLMIGNLGDAIDAEYPAEVLT